MTAANPYAGAYPVIRGRRAVWREIARFVARDSPRVDTLVELGPGYCDFVNQFPAQRKIAIDLNPEMTAFADPDVELRIGDAAEQLPLLGEASVDLLFASNFLEHVRDAEIERLMPAIHRCLRPGGRVALLQPNYRLCAAHYFDDPTHVTIFDERSLVERLERHGLNARRVEPGLLPFSMNSRLPKWGWLTRLYLSLPLRPLAAQMYVLAERA